MSRAAGHGRPQGGPAYYRSSEQQFVYGGRDGNLEAYLFSGTALTLAKVGGNPDRSPGTFGDGGTMPNVSSNQEEPGTAVVCAIARGNRVVLQAFAATNLTHKVFSSDAAKELDAGSWSSGNAMIEPTAVQFKARCMWPGGVDDLRSVEARGCPRRLQ
jgi:hypothetical protein